MEECYVGSQQLSQDAELQYDTFEMKYLHETTDFMFAPSFQISKKEFVTQCESQGLVNWNKYKQALLTCVPPCSYNTTTKVITGLTKSLPAFLKCCILGIDKQVPKKQFVQLCAENGVFGWDVIYQLITNMGCSCDGNVVQGLTIEPVFMHKTISRIKKRNALLTLCSNIIQQRQSRLKRRK